MKSISDILKRIESEDDEASSSQVVEEVALEQKEKKSSTEEVQSELFDDSEMVTYEEKSLISDNVVTQDNVLVKASYSLSLNAKRILLLCLSKVDSRRADLYQSNYKMKVSAKEWQEYYGGHSKSIYREFNNGLDDLFDADIVEVDNDSELKTFRWISARHYYKNLGYAELTLTQDVMKYVSNLSSAFTSYKLMAVGKLRSVYGIRLFELLMTTERKGISHGFLAITIEDLRLIFSLPDSRYRRFAEFNRAVIKKAVTEINEKTFLDVHYEVIKIGKVASSIKFHYKKKTEKTLLIESEY